MSEEKEVKKKKLYVPFYHNGSKIYEMVSNGYCPMFLCYEVGKGFTFEETVEDYSQIYHPISEGSIPYSNYEITPELFQKINKPNFQPDFLSLYQRVYDEFDTFLDLEDQYKQLLTAFTFETYQQHKLSKTGYIAILGAHDCGKTRALELLSELTYRPLNAVGIPEANIFNYIGTREEGLCTILEDEIQEVTKKQNGSKLAIYRSGYKKGATTPRIIEGGSKDRKQKFYKTYCPKVFSGYHLPRGDEALKSRCIPVPMVDGNPKLDEFDDEGKDIARMQKLKAEILIYRMKNYFEPLPELKVPIKKRVKELWKGKILSVIGTPAEQVMSQMALDFQKRKYKNLCSSLEAYVVKTVIYLGQRYKWLEIRFDELWHTLLITLGVECADQFTDSSVDVPLLGYKVSKKKVGEILGSTLHGESNARFGIGRTWLFDVEKMKRLAKRFLIEKKHIKEIEDIINGINEINDLHD